MSNYNNNKNMDLTMNHTLPKILLSMAKNHPSNTNKLKLLVQGLQPVELLHKFEEA